MRSAPRALAAIGAVLLPLVAAAALAQTQGVRIIVQSSPLAGFRHHEAAYAWHLLRIGDDLELVRERDNPFDANAIRVEWRGRKLGYVPRRANGAIAWGLDRGETLRARISALNAGKPASKRIEFEVFVERRCNIRAIINGDAAMKITTLALLLSLPLATATLQGCFPVVAAGAGAAAVSANDRRTSGTQIEDEGIELRAGNRISERYGDRAHVSATSYNRAVLLTGEAPDAAAKAEIEKIARAVPNVRGVTNDLQVAAPSTLSARANDAFVTSKVKARYVDAQRFNPLHVKVLTDASVVYLLGIVTDREAADAVEIARTTGGVKKVVRIFELCRPSDEACRPAEATKGDAPRAKDKQ